MDKNAIAKTKKTLEQKIQATNTHWNICKETAGYLASLVEKKRPMRCLEIGTSTGYSAICIAEAIYPWGGTLTTVESNRKRFDIAKQNIANSTLDNITQVLGHAPEILHEIAGTFDFIFLDATKYEHVSYFEALRDRITLGGIIVADNMTSHEADMDVYKKTVDTDPQFESVIENIGAGLMVSIKQ